MSTRAQSVSTNGDPSLLEGFVSSPNQLIDERVRESFSFFGLAFYYNTVSFHLVGKDTRRLDQRTPYTLAQGDWLCVVGRFNVLLVSAAGLSVTIDEEIIELRNIELLSKPGSAIWLAQKDELEFLAPDSFSELRYAHLWGPLQLLTQGIDYSLVKLYSAVANWGIALLLFAVLLKLGLLPLSVLTTGYQRRVSQIQAELDPIILEIRENYVGEEAHNRQMAAYKQLGVSPFFALKPMVGLLIQLPILVATFNALGEMPQFSEQSFLWIPNLAYPDEIAQIGFRIPLLGDTVHLTPFLMALVTVGSTMLFTNTVAPVVEIRRQKRNLYLMAIGFFFLFYPFPAVMVLYWAFTNLLQAVQQHFLKI